MKKMYLLFLSVICLLSGGCEQELEEDKPDTTLSEIIARASHTETFMRSSFVADKGRESVVFTGSDILWFNETTKEIRFQENVSIKNVISIHQSVKIYIGNEYLFSSMICVSSLNSQIFNSLVLYYNMVENKYYLLDGYPEVAVLSDPQEAQKLRNENRQTIASEWKKFIDQLKKEGRYKN